MKTCCNHASSKVWAMRQAWSWLCVVTTRALLTTIAVIGISCVANAAEDTPQTAPLLQLGIGDEIRFQVFGQPDLDSMLYITDDGTVTIPLAGSVKISGLSPTEAAAQLEKALRDGNYLVNPHVTLTVTQTRSQRVSVLGEVGLPGRYAIDSSTTIFDLLAQAGGVTQAGSETVFIIRQGKDGAMQRYPVQLRGLADASFNLPIERLQAGDSVYVPRAEQYYITGEITAPGAFRLEPDMTVLQAIARAGGVGPRGSMNRIVIKRRVNESKYKTFSASLTDPIKPDDIIQVKESIF